MKTNYKNLLLTLLLVSPMVFSQQTVLVDFGGPTQNTANNYNNLDDPSDMTAVPLINDTGASSGLTVTLTNALIDINFNGPGSSGSPGVATGDAAFFEAQATRDSFFGSSNHGGIDDQLGTFEFTGLDNSKFYSFTIFAARIPGSNDRVAQYEFVGATTLSATLNASDNAANVAVVNNVQPTGGKITLNVTPHSSNTHPSKYFYMGALKMLETDAVLATRDEVLAENGLNIYPNPVQDELTIDLLNNDVVTTISIYDIQGRLVYSVKNEKSQIESNSFKWNRLNNKGNRLLPGTYFLKLQTESKSFTKKLILE